MPSPGTKPPTKRGEELRTKITAEMWKKFNKEGSKTLSELHERDTKMINELIARLADALEKLEIYEK